VASVPVGRTELYQQDGISQMWKSDDILGNPNYSPYLFGTVHPESVRMVDNYVYFFDVYRGAYVRDAVNGMVAISGKRSGQADYKMESYFKGKSVELISSGLSNTKVITSWDDEHGLVIVTFKDTVDATHNETVAFHEGTNRWVSFLEFEGKQTTNIATTFAMVVTRINSITVTNSTNATALTNSISITSSGTQTVSLYWKILDSDGDRVSYSIEAVDLDPGENTETLTITTPVVGTDYVLHVWIEAGSVAVLSNEFDSL
jgi:hypothetical protein